MIKDGAKVTSRMFYQEQLIRAMERKERVSIRSVGFTGMKTGILGSVGFNEFKLIEEDGTSSSIMIDDVIDIN